MLPTRRLAWAAMLLVVLALSGCDGDQREPFPFLNVVVRSDGTYLIDGRSFDRPTFEREIDRLGEALRRQITHDARAYVYVKGESGVGYERIQATVGRVMQAGFNNIQTTGN